MYSRSVKSSATGPFTGWSASRARGAEAASSLPRSRTRPPFSTWISSIGAHFLGDGGGADPVLVLVADGLRELADHVDAEPADRPLGDGAREIRLGRAGDVVGPGHVEFAERDRDGGIPAL